MIIGAVLLLALVAITYRDAPENGFHLDDSRNIFRYPPVMVTDLKLELAGPGKELESVRNWYRSFPLTEGKVLG